MSFVGKAIGAGANLIRRVRYGSHYREILEAKKAIEIACPGTSVKAKNIRFLGGTDVKCIDCTPPGRYSGTEAKYIPPTVATPVQGVHSKTVPPTEYAGGATVAKTPPVTQAKTPAATVAGPFPVTEVLDPALTAPKHWEMTPEWLNSQAGQRWLKSSGAILDPAAASKPAPVEAILDPAWASKPASPEAILDPARAARNLSGQPPQDVLVKSKKG